MQPHLGHMMQGLLMDRKIKNGARGLVFCTIVRAMFDYLILRQYGVVKDFKLIEEEYDRLRKGQKNKRFLADYSKKSDIQQLIYFLTTDNLDKMINMSGYDLDPEVVRSILNSDRVAFSSEPEKVFGMIEEEVMKYASAPKEKP